MVATRVPNFPLIISVARDSSAVLAACGETGHVALRTLVIMLLGAFATAALSRQFRRIELSQRALRQSEERYALALEGANEGHFDWNFDARPGFVSPQMQRLHGRVPGTPISTREAWMATSVDIHPDDKAGIEDAINKHLQGGLEHYDTEYRVRHPDGDWHWLHARGRFMRDASGASDRLVGSVIDITARKNAEAEKDRLEIQLRQSQKMEAMGHWPAASHTISIIFSAPYWDTVSSHRRRRLQPAPCAATSTT